MRQEFRVKARTLVHLGAELITTDTIALNELIKNAFDARSEEVRISFDIPFNPMYARQLAEQVSAGALTRQRAVEGLKAALAEELSKEDEDNLRAQLDGLPEDEKAFSCSLRELADKVCTISIEDWGDGMSRSELWSVFLVIGTPGKYLKKRDRSSVTPILGDKGIGRLSMMRLGRYATVVTAKKGTPRYYQIDFDWTKFEDPEQFLDDIKHEVVAAGPKGSSQDSGTLIEISGLYSDWSPEDVSSFIAYLRRLQDPFNSGHKRFPIRVFRNGSSQPIGRINRRLVESAQFEAHFDFLPGNHDDAIALERRLRWKGETTFVKREWTVRSLCHDLEATVDDLKELGELRVGCYWYNRSRLSHPTGEWDVHQIRRELNVWSGGFAIYRDGFRIGLTGSEEGDWMRMGAAALRGTGFRLNNIQTIGAIALSYANNPALIDTTNREDLVDCPEYRLLTRLMKTVVVEDLRFVIQTYTEAESRSALAERTSEVSMKRAADDMQSTLKQVGNLAKRVPTNVKPNVISIRNSLKQHVDYIRTVQKSVQLAQEQKVEILELAGIGMSVEIIAHELARVTKRTADLLGQITGTSDEKKLEKLVESVESQLISVNKRLRAIDPLSPSGRNRKVEFDLVGFLKGILEGYGPRFERHRVTPSLTVDGKLPRQAVNVRMVRGFIAQVAENLLSNSMYWLSLVPVGPASERRIAIDIDRHGRFVEVYDSGPGIDPRHREDVFKPYFTYKKNGKGLGLYIARELTEYHGGKLSLSDDAEGDGRLRRFVLEFPKD
jgi:signal transduction histidine kinase